MTKIDDPLTCMAFTVSFVPNTGNKYFLGACDDVVRLYDFETAELLQTFPTKYSSYCDCLRFVKIRDEQTTEDEKALFFVTRGVELLDDESIREHFPPHNPLS